MYIYKLGTNLDDRVYIGQTKAPKSRLRRHKYDLKNGNHHSAYLQRFYDKHAEEGLNLTFEIIYEDPDQELIDLVEEELIFNLQGKIFNVSLKAKGGDLISNYPNREAIVQKHKENWDKIHKYRMKPFTKESSSGKNNFNYKHGNCIKTLRKCVDCGYESFGIFKPTYRCRSCSAKKRCLDYPNPFLGKSHTEETREVIRKRHLERCQNIKDAGGLIPGSRPIFAEGLLFRSSTDAAKYFGVCAGTAIFRTKSKNWKFRSWYEAKSPKVFEDLTHVPERVCADGVRGLTKREACELLGIRTETLAKRLSSDSYPEYFYESPITCIEPEYQICPYVYEYTDV